MGIFAKSRAIKSITACGGQCLQAYAWSTSKDVPRPQWQKLLLKMLLADYWSPVTSVCFWRGEITEDAMRAMKDLPSLVSVVFDGTTLPPSGLKELDCKNLEELYLQGSNIDDTNVKQLVHFRKLRILNIDDTKVGDIGAESFFLLPSLDCLSVEGTLISNNMVQRLDKQFPKLTFNSDE